MKSDYSQIWTKESITLWNPSIRHVPTWLCQDTEQKQKQNGVNAGCLMAAIKPPVVLQWDKTTGVKF